MLLLMVRQPDGAPSEEGWVLLLTFTDLDLQVRRDAVVLPNQPCPAPSLKKIWTLMSCSVLGFIHLMLKNLPLPANYRLNNFSQMTLKKLGMPPEEQDHVLGRGFWASSQATSPTDWRKSSRRRMDGWTTSKIGTLFCSNLVIDYKTCAVSLCSDPVPLELPPSVIPPPQVSACCIRLITKPVDWASHHSIIS